MTCELRTNREGVTDRALRYRAHQCPPAPPRRCDLCGSKRFLVIDHIDGHEENNAPGNLRWLCKSCNTRLGAEMARNGKGRRTKQFNAGAQTLAEYSEAVSAHQRGAHDLGGAIIHQTPKSRRSQFAREIWSRRKSRWGDSGRINPGGVEEVFEDFHGYPSSEDLVFDLVTVEHGRLASLGELVELVIRPQTGGRVTLGEFAGAVLATNARRNQLYVVGGDQSVDLEAFGIERPHEAELLGQVLKLVYYTNKTHLGEHGGEADYHHAIGEESGVLPVAVYDSLNQRLSFAGGAYTIETEGIRD